MVVRIVIAAVLGTVLATFGTAADPISGDLVGLNLSLVSQKQLAVCDQLLAGEEWDAAIDLLEKLQAEGTEGLIQVAPGHYVGLKIAIQQRLCRMPANGKEIYQRRIQSVVQSLTKRAIDEKDDLALVRIADEFAASSAAANATDRLASRSAQRGDLELALRMWGRGVTTAGEQASQAFPAFRVDFGPALSVERKWLAARHLAGIPLSEEERESLTANSDPHWSELVTEDESFTTSINVPSELRWSTWMTENSPLRELGRAMSIGTSHKIVVLNNGRQVRALHLETGDPFWPSGLPIDVGQLFSDPQDDQKDSQRRELPCRMSGGAIAGDRYFGVVGDAPQWSARPPLIPRSSELCCLDLGIGEGRTLWHVKASSLPESWQFHGAPMIAPGLLPGDDRLVIPICRPQQQVELGLAAFRQDDGTLIWWTRIGTATAESGVPIPEPHLVVCGGLAVARTLTGVVAAIDTRTGSLQWATTRMVASPVIQRDSPFSLIDAMAGQVVVADPSSNRLVSLSTDSGELFWEKALDDQIQGVTVAAPDRVLVSGHRLLALSLRDGNLEWEHGTGDPLDGGTGLPAVRGPLACWPTRTSLWGLDLRSGRVRFHRPLTSSPLGSPMRVISTADAFLIALPDELAVFEVR